MLENIRILDLSRLLPGPYCSMLLADLGCHVIKIEEPTTGDYARWMPPFINTESARFLSVNRNKKSMTLNLKTEKGRGIFMQLVERSDVVLESFRPGILQALQIHYEEAQKVNPGIVYCSITAYGQDGPYTHKAAHDINVIGLGGVLSITRNREIPGVQIADTASGLLACIGILSALLFRERTGKGQHVDISMLDGIISLLSVHAGEYFATRKSPVPEKMALSGGLACYNVYETNDEKFITLGALESKFWQEFCTAVERDDLVPHQFDEDQEELKQIISSIFKERSQQEWMDTLENVCAPVNNLEMVCRNPQVLHRNMVSQVEHPAAGVIDQVGTPIKSSLCPAEIRLPPPLFGEHTRSILQDIGISEAEIEELREEGVI
ncbi:MAG: CoA transferase [Theionarchaea archaeon]|nr:CoA transferase [Theionarchaea archaeon]MBU7001681.1 CoA transferase [Theionarchaea archaeon]